MSTLICSGSVVRLGIYALVLNHTSRYVVVRLVDTITIVYWFYSNYFQPHRAYNQSGGHKLHKKYCLAGDVLSSESENFFIKLYHQLHSEYMILDSIYNTFCKMAFFKDDFSDNKYR